ncbi:MAG: hypothetical protein JKY70_06395 [Mucilaginibacter sp.]|nr:hypothetical protein [Mucilaginibacter sp.]
MGSILKASLISFILQIIVMLAYALIINNTIVNNWDIRILLMITAGSLWTNLIFTILIIPGNIATESFEVNKHKLVAYFLVPTIIFAVFLVRLLISKDDDNDFYLIAITTFILSHVYVLSKNKFIL